MRVQMPWFPPLGLLTGLGGTGIARHLLQTPGHRHRRDAWFVLALTWFPLLVWALVQFPFLEK